MKNQIEKSYLRRKIDTYLINWKRNKNRLPLIVKGARQVGKTASIMKFGQENYVSFLYVNFSERPEFKAIIRDGFSAKSIIRNISIVEPNFKLIPDKTLIVFDELQEFPEIATAFKFLSLDGRYDVIASGSLLGIQYKRIASISVGYQSSVTMRSMDFEEYLWALGYSDGQLESLIETPLAKKSFSQAEMLVFDRLFMDYCALGGMPAVISSFVQNGNFSSVQDIQNAILDNYRSDVRKYCEGLEPARIQTVFNAIPSLLAAENKKFKYSVLEHDARKKDYFGCVEWLRDAGIINICPRMRVLELPIMANLDNDSFKIYLGDSGLLCQMIDKWAQEDIRIRRNLGTWKGGFFENVVAEAIVKAGSEPVYYKKDSSTLEIDFLLRSRDCLVPIEVKSENATGKSLRYLVESQVHKDIRWGLKVVHGNVGMNNGILTIPQWCAFLLPKIVENFPAP